MSTPSDSNEIMLNALRLRITSVLPSQIRTCVEQLDHEQLWWRPNASSNSVANLVLHLAGAIQEFLCRRIGGFEYARDREAEFAKRGTLEKKEVLARFDDAVAKAIHTLDAFPPSRLTAPSTIPDNYFIAFEDLLGVAFHMAVHAGQIVYVTKMLKEGCVQEIWGKTHRAAGAWRT